MSPLGALQNLETLSLARCTALTDVSALGRCKSLVSLNLSYLRGLMDISALIGCEKLIWLDLSLSGLGHNQEPIMELCRRNQRKFLEGAKKAGAGFDLEGRV